MARRISSLTPLWFLFLPLLSASLTPGQDLPETKQAQGPQPIANWPAPLLWTPAAARTPSEAHTVEASTVATPLPFIALTPCRVADTRGNGFTGAFGPPALVVNATRTFTITGQCGIPVTAAAVSFNFGALNVGGAGDLRVFPAGGGVPLVSTLNYNANTPNIANAAIVPLGTGGAITVQADAASIDLIIDVNGYYDNSGLIIGVTAGTGLTGGGTSGTVSLGIAPGGVTSTELASNAVTAPKIAANAVTAGAIASGQVVKNVNGVTDSVTVAGSGLVTVNTAGSTITVGGGGMPSGSLILGAPNDTSLISQGFTEIGPLLSGRDPVIWRAMTTVGAPTGRSLHTAVWTGTRMIVWGGYDGTNANTGGQYDPVGDSWTPTTTTGAPAGRLNHTAVWTGTKMIVWGGSTVGFSHSSNSGGQYDPVGDSWTATTTTGAPTRASHAAVWTGMKMIIWGGHDETTFPTTGGQYNPFGDFWTATKTTGAPTGRLGFAAVWTGTKMIIWGGFNDILGYLNTGGQYDPIGNSWTATTITGAPTIGAGPTAVWTGTKMIVWGGADDLLSFNAGGQYDPVGNSWAATTTTGAPTARHVHTAVWTGTKMIIWGGRGGNDLDGISANTGGQYDPAGNFWTATTTIGAPTARFSHTAVWTGTKMIVWGGLDGTNANTGGQYSILSLYMKN